MAQAGRLLASQDAGGGGDPSVSFHHTSNGMPQLRVTLPDDSTISPGFTHGAAYFARPFVQRWVAVACGMGTWLVGAPRDVHFLSRVSMEGAIGSSWGVPIFHFTGEEIEHGPTTVSGTPRSPRGKKAKKKRGDGSRTSSSGRDLRTQEYALIFRFWKDDKNLRGGVQMAGNEYPAGPTGSDVISFVS